METLRKNKGKDRISGQKGKGLLFLLLLPFLFLGFPAASRAEGATPSDAVVEPLDFSEQEGISLSLSYGYQNTAKSGRFLPVDVKIGNHTANEIRGNVVIEVPGSGMGRVRYAYPAEVPAGKSRDVRGTVSLSGKTEELRILLYDEADQLIAESRELVNIQGSAAELLIGILSNSPQELSYFRGVSIANSPLKTRTVTLTPGEIPADGAGLDQLDLIVISDFSMYRLSDESVQAILSWVDSGGALLIGTGKSGDVLGKFAGYLPEIELSELEERHVDMGIQYSTDGPDGAMISLPVRNVYMSEGMQAMQSQDIAVLTTVSAGSGVIGITAYDLCDIKDFCMEQIGYTDELLTALLGSARINRYAALGMEEGGFFETVRKLLQTGSTDRLPNLLLYLTFAAGYMVLAGPGLYFYLKQRGFAVYYPLSVVFVSALAAFFLFFLGMRVRFDGPFVGYAAIRELSEDTAEETELIRLAAPGKEPVSISLSPEYAVQPVMPEAERREEEGAFWQRYSEGLITLSQNEAEKRIQTEQMRPFEESYFMLTKRRERTGELPISAKLNLFDDRLSGSVTNHSETDFVHVTLLLYGRIISVGELKGGETRDLALCEVVYGPTASAELTSAYITGIDTLPEGSEAYGKAVSESSLLSYYMQDALGNYYPGAKLVAFMKNEELLPSFAHTGIDCYGTTLLVMPAEVDPRSGREVFRSAFVSDPKLISGAYKADSNTTEGSAAVVLEYSLGNDLEVTSLRFNALSEPFSGKETGEGTFLVPFRGVMSIYNYETSSYDLIDSGKLYFKKEEIRAYLSPGNTVTVRYIPDENAAGSAEMFLPVPTVTGVDRNADR